LNIIQNLAAIMKRLDMGVIDARLAQREVEGMLSVQGYGTTSYSKYLFHVFKEYFQNPTIPAEVIMGQLKISVHELREIQQEIQRMPLFSDLWQSLLFPRSLLMRYAYQLTKYLHANPGFINAAMNSDSQLGMYMLEIHPTSGACIYSCKMCLWSGGGQLTAKQIKEGARTALMPTSHWITVLEEAKCLGVERIIVSGGGETLLDEKKFREVMLSAVRLGIKVMIYTNGRLLASIRDETICAIMQADWLRVSCHAATPEVYAQLVNRPIGNNDLAIVVEGIKRVISRKHEVNSPLKVGVGIVLQKTNFRQLPLMNALGESLGIDFLDIRGDCIDITDALTDLQRERMFHDLNVAREESLSSKLSFRLSISDDLQLQLDQWKLMTLTLSGRCWIPVLRPAIDPFGTVCACDSIGEPFTRSVSPEVYVFGTCQSSSLRQIFQQASQEPLGIWCQHCMPGQVALNALFEKIVADFKIGIRPCDQPFFNP